MRKQNSISLQITTELLDMKNISQTENGYVIPLKKNKEVMKAYDETYRALGRGSGFVSDRNYTHLNLIVNLNILHQYRFFLTGKFKEICMIDNLPEEQLGTFEAKQEITLSDSELLSINKEIKHLF